MAIDTKDIQGRVAFISGASRGIGAGIATRAQELGMRLVLCSRTPPAIPEGEGVLSRSLDVRDAEGIEALAREAEERFGRIDLWINNAGVLEPVGPARDVDVAAFREHVDINLTGVLIGSQCYVQHLRRWRAEHASSGEDGGVLINMSSGASWNAYEGWAAYCASKAGVERLTEVIAKEEAETGLRAYSIAPGLVDTDMQTKVRAASAEVFPDVDKFLEFKAMDAFNSERYVANEFLAVAFDPARRPETVAIRLENEPKD